MSESEERIEDSFEEDSPTEAEPMDPVNADEEPEKLSPYVQGPDAVDITPDQDGGVMKEIKRCGSGDDHPMTGDKVFVHYVGTLADGTKFDSSRDRGQKFEFSLGTGTILWIVTYGVYILSHMYVIAMVIRMVSGLFAPGPVRSLEIPANRTLADSLPGHFIRWNFRSLSVSLPGQFAARQVRSLELSLSGMAA